MNNSYFFRRMSNCGIPCNIDSKALKTKKFADKIMSFLEGKTNLAIIGEEHYSWAVKISKLKLANNINEEIVFISCNQVLTSYMRLFDTSIIRAVVVHSIHEMESENQKVHISAFIDHLLTQNVQVLISANSLKDVSSAFSKNIDSIDKNFEVMKV